MDAGASVWVPALVSAAAGAATTAAGAYSQNKAQNMDAEHRYKALQADKLRQQALQDEADAKLRQGVDKFAGDDLNQQVDLAAAARTAALPQQAAPAAQYQAATPSAPVQVTNESSRVMAKAGDKARQEAARKAKLAAYGDVSMQQNFGINRLNEDIRRLGGESAGSTRIMGVESGLEDTGSPGWRNRAGIANTLGQIGTLYSMGAGTRKPPAGYMTGLPGDAGNPYG